MSQRNCFVLLQHREDSEYNDFIGKFYHFPQKYYNQLTSDNAEFIYYEPSKKGAGVYFGTGKIGKVFEDKREPGQFFAEISEYKTFSIPVPFLDPINNLRRETGPGYNAQNAVRSVESLTFEEICLDGGVLLNFKADAHLIKVLGEQLIGSEKVGILELIKNGIDAGASYCKVRIEQISDIEVEQDIDYKFFEYPGPVIVIEDDGRGMSREIIEQGWLRPASTIKTNVKEKIREEKKKAEESGILGSYNALIEQLKKEHKGRIPLGEKGVGRFATHRLGKNLIIKTKTVDVNYEFVLRINWADFDVVGEDSIDLDSVGIQLTRQPPSRDYGAKNSGTQLIIFGGKEGFTWDKASI